MLKLLIALRTKYRNLSVTWKFILAYFAILIVPLIFTGVYLYIQTSNSVIAQAQIVMEQNLLQTKSSILQKVKIIENISQLVAFDTKLQTFLENGFENEAYQFEDYQYNILPSLENMLRQNKTIYSIRVYMFNPTIPELADCFYNISRIQNEKRYQEWLGKNSQKYYGWGTIHQAKVNIPKSDRAPTEQVFSYYRQIFSMRSDELVGLLEIEIKESILFDILRDPISNKFGKIYIVNTRSEVVSNNIPAILGRKIAPVHTGGFPKNAKLNQVKKINHKESIVISIPIAEIGCNIVGTFPVSSFNQKVRSSVTAIVLVLIASSLLLGLIIYLTTNRLLGRIHTLAKAMKQVREGNLDVSVPVNARDEFGELTLSFNHMTGRIHELVETVYKIQLMEREAELKALEAQINPHFLYNTLATISWAARKVNSSEIVTISNSLARFYRLVLNKGNTLISVREELDMAQAYLQIQKIRFEAMFDVIYEIDETVCKYQMMKNILQPLVENALTHGIEPKRNHGTIIIKSFAAQDKLYFKIIDDGVGMSSETLDNILAGKVERSGGSGYAIKNILERLQAYYGPNHTFHFFSKPGIGTAITIMITLVDK